MIQIDALLAGDGVVPEIIAAEWGVDPKTVRRVLDAIGQVLPITHRKINNHGKRAHVYADKRQRLFSAAAVSGPNALIDPA